MSHKVIWKGHPMRLELTHVGLLVELANHYTTRGALAILNNAVDWIVSTRPPTSKSSRPFNNYLVTLPNAPITIGIIVTFMFHSFFNSLASLSYEVHSISFQTCFVQAFKIVIDSWKFSMLLLSILWDDRPIFMISGSNEQLQQQLEYTLLNPDCHSWWIAFWTWGHFRKRYEIKFYFKLGKNATETYRMLQTAFEPSCMNRASVFEGHKRVKEGRECVRDDKRCWRSKEVNTPELIDQRVRVRVTILRF